MYQSFTDLLSVQYVQNIYHNFNIPLSAQSPILEMGPTWAICRLSHEGSLQNIVSGEVAYQYDADKSGQGVTAFVVDTGTNDHKVRVLSA
jgi:hypothetical protein